MEELKKEIEAVNDMTDVRKDLHIRERLLLMNINDPEVQKMWSLAKEKGIIV